MQDQAAENTCGMNQLKVSCKHCLCRPLYQHTAELFTRIWGQPPSSPSTTGESQIKNNYDDNNKSWSSNVSNVLDIGPNKYPCHWLFINSLQTIFNIIQTASVKCYQPQHLILVLDAKVTWPLPLFSWVNTITDEEALLNYSGAQHTTGKWHILRINPTKYYLEQDWTSKRNCLTAKIILEQLKLEFTNLSWSKLPCRNILTQPSVIYVTYYSYCVPVTTEWFYHCCSTNIIGVYQHQVKLPQNLFFHPGWSLKVCEVATFGQMLTFNIFCLSKRGNPQSFIFLIMFLRRCLLLWCKMRLQELN